MNNLDFILNCEKVCSPVFAKLEEIALFNQNKVLDAFKDNKIALRHFAPSTGYGYDDIGKEALSNVFKHTFKAQSALVSPLFMSGTHAISTALFGLLRPNQTALSITGTPYNTLKKAIYNKNIGSLKDFNINFEIVDLIDGEFNFEEIVNAINNLKPQIIYVQRSKGYTFRKALSISSLKEIFTKIKQITNAKIVVDNCYGEFISTQEPLEIGADLIIGSLIKNAGGGLASSGAYIAGNQDLINQIEGRYSAPGVGFEIGSYPFTYQYLFQGFFLAPHTVLQASKSATLFNEAFYSLGYDVLGYNNSNKHLLPSDITCAIKFNDKQKMISFCQAVQDNSPVDSHVTLQPTFMPGYENPIIMASGAFVQGSSIELSADGPVTPPYIAYFQGSLTYEHAKIALNQILNSFLNEDRHEKTII